MVRLPETVESAIPNVSAISAAVKRSTRSFVIASTRSGVVRLATRVDAERQVNETGFAGHANDEKDLVARPNRHASQGVHIRIFKAVDNPRVTNG